MFAKVCLGTAKLSPLRIKEMAAVNYGAIKVVFLSLLLTCECN